MLNNHLLRTWGRDVCRLWFLLSRRPNVKLCESRRAFLLGCVTFRSLWTAACWSEFLFVGNVARCQSPPLSPSCFLLFSVSSVPPFSPAASWPCLRRRLQHTDLFSECFKSFHSDLECDIVHILLVGCGTNSWIIKSRTWSSETEKHERDAGLRKTATALVGEESHSQGSCLSVNGSFLLPKYVFIVWITGVPSVGTLLFLPDTQRLSGNHGGGWYQDISSPSLKTTNVSLCFSRLEELSCREHLRGHIKLKGSSRWSPHVEIKSSF